MFVCIGWCIKEKTHLPFPTVSPRTWLFLCGFSFVVHELQVGALFWDRFAWSRGTKPDTREKWRKKRRKESLHQFSKKASVNPGQWTIVCPPQRQRAKTPAAVIFENHSWKIATDDNNNNSISFCGLTGRNKWHFSMPTRVQIDKSQHDADWLHLRLYFLLKRLPCTLINSKKMAACRMSRKRFQHPAVNVA